MPVIAKFEELEEILVSGTDEDPPESDDYSEDSYP